MTNIFDALELQEVATVSILETAQKEGSRNVKRFILDDERLKQGHKFGKAYFDKLIDKHQ